MLLGDIVVFARTPEELLERWRTILNRLREVGLKVKPSKYAVFKSNVKSNQITFITFWQP